MDKEKDLADYVMHYIAKETGATDLNVGYILWQSHDREDGDELLGLSDVKVRYKDMCYEYSMPSEYLKIKNVDEILNKHMPAIKEWMINYKEPICYQDNSKCLRNK